MYKLQMIKPYKIFLLIILAVIPISCSYSKERVKQGNSIRVIDDSRESRIKYRTIYLAQEKLSNKEIDYLSKISGFTLLRQNRGIKNLIFLSITNRDSLSIKNMEQGLRRINKVKFIKEAKFEPLVKVPSK